MLSIRGSKSSSSLRPHNRSRLTPLCSDLASHLLAAIRTSELLLVLQRVQR